MEPQCLVEVLPLSPKRLSLAGGLSEQDVLTMPGRLVEQKAERLPKLGSIVLEDCGPYGENVAEICATAGVKLKFLNNKP